MACYSPTTDLSLYTADTANCRLTVYDPNSRIDFQFDLGTTIARNVGFDKTSAQIQDDKTGLTLTSVQMAQLGLTVAGITTAAGACRLGGAGGSVTAVQDLSLELESLWVFDVDANENKYAEITQVRATGAKTYTFYDGVGGSVVAAPTGLMIPYRDDTAGLNPPIATDIVASTSSVQLLAANPKRTRVTIVNNNVEVMRISKGIAATQYDVPYSTDEYFVEESWKGAVFGVWAAGATGQGARVTEFTID